MLPEGQPCLRRRDIRDLRDERDVADTLFGVNGVNGDNGFWWVDKGSRRGEVKLCFGVYKSISANMLE